MPGPFRLSARGPGGTVPIDADAANTVVMRDGLIARFEMFWDRDAAFAAAGLARLLADDAAVGASPSGRARSTRGP